MNIEWLGWLGAFCFSMCAVPQLVLTLKTGNAKGVSIGFLLLWLIGEISMGVFMYLSGSMKVQLAVNYCFNVVCIMLILKYRIFPRKEVPNE